MSLPAFDDIPEPQAAPRRGLLLLLDVIAAPRRAFVTIAATREWLPAFLLVTVLGVAGSLLLAPALEHVIGHETLSDPSGTRTSAADVARLAGSEVANEILLQTIGALMFWVWTAVILTAVSGKGPKSFLVYFSLAANTAIPAAIGFFVFSAFIAAHNPAGYSSFSDLNRALPDSLAIFETQPNEGAVAFLASFDVFQLWSSLLLAFGLYAIGKVELFWALVTSFALWLVFALLQTVGL